MISDESFNTFIGQLSKFKTLDPSFYLSFRPLLFERDFPKGASMLISGVKPDVIYFILSGSAREETVHPVTGMRHTTWMWFSLDFVYSNPGFFSQQPAQSRVEAMEPCQVIYLSFIDFNKMETDFVLLRSLAEKIRDHYFVALKLHAMDLANFTNQERYDQFISAHPQSLVTLNHRHMLSFLGIHDKGLGRYFSRKSLLFILLSILSTP